MSEEIWTPEPELLTMLQNAVQRGSDPDKPIAGSSKRTYSTREILQEVREGTPFGRKYQVAWKRNKQ